MARTLAAFVLAGLGVFEGGPAAASEPWTLSEYLGVPSSLFIEGSYRVRYEALDGQFRAGANGSDEMLVERLLLHARFATSSIYAGAELQDSRAQLANSGSPVGTDDVNTFELLRAYLGYRRSSVLRDGDELDLTLGRITIDTGSRRLVARNRFRNTLNAFAGIHGRWTGTKGDQLQAFLIVPVERRPGDAASLLDNRPDFDRDADHVRFWGIHYTKPAVFGHSTGELYLYGLNENDPAERATTHRELYTPGFRLFKTPRDGQLDYEIETALQFGETRRSASTAAPLLDQFARFHHAHIAFTADNAWKTRVVLQYDYASGDDDPSDGESGRFDTLFGARRFDLGPTGIYGALARSNISSPGARLEAKPSDRLNWFAGYRAVFLASERDALTAAGLQDLSGASGRFVGHQVETRVGYFIAPGNLSMEIGAAYLMKGRFLKDAPNSLDRKDTVYVYSHLTWVF